MNNKNTVWRRVFTKRMLICVLTGFSSGLPLYLLIQLLPAWLRKEGISLEVIGLFSLFGLPYAWKFLWAPLVDRYTVPWLGRRRGWMLVCQLLLLVSIAGFGFINPKESIVAAALLAGVVAFFSASQDIVIDAYRRELLPDEELGLGNSIHVQAYRIAGLVPGMLAFVLSDHMPWTSVYVIVALFMLVGVGLTLFFPEPIQQPQMPSTLRSAVVEPFTEFIDRQGARKALMIIVFIFLYKLGDNMAVALSSPFYLDLGFSMSEIGIIVKNFALWPAILGGLLGGIWMLKLGINRALWIFGLFQWLTIFGFAWLAEIGDNKVVLATVIAAEYAAVGLGTSAFIAFIARETNPRYAATQLALFTALASVPRIFANATTGFIVAQTGWTSFFLICAALAIPGLLLLWWVAPLGTETELE
ncbi:MAG: AmpG family muropeptide MFS transporter [Pseudomonadales bacterium]